MSVITESTLRAKMAKGGWDRVLKVRPGDIITTAARDYIKEQRIEVLQEEPGYTPMEWRESSAGEGFEDEAGNCYREKPEHLTHLRGKKLVHKTHPRIVFRGKMDCLQAEILQAQLAAHRAGHNGLLADLEETLQYARSILGTEVREVPLEPLRLFGMDDGELRRASHNPREQYGIGHFLASWQMGEEMVALNSLRTAAREAELAAAAAFPESRDWQEDVIRALNRLSSAVYILMCRRASGYYGKE